MGSQIKKIFTYSFALSDFEARQKSEEFVRSIDENPAYLKEQCNDNGNAIMKKWKKKSREKREGLLRSVDPDLYPHQWFYAHFNQSFLDSMIKKLSINGEIDTDFTQGKQLRKHRKSCLLPYLNVEGLSKNPMRLLGLLYNCTKYSPEQWAPFDNSLLEKHWAIGSLALDYNSHSIIMYGPRAILILEAQAHLLTFLRSVVEQILCSSNASLVNKQTTMFDEAFQHGLKRSSGTFGYTLELASSYLNQPFSAPPSFDIDTLSDIARTRQALQGDHLWLLQTDPLYARRYINLEMTSNLEENSKPYHQFFLGGNSFIQYSIMFWSWGWIFDETPKLKGLLTSHEILDSVKPLWKVYDELLGALEALLLNQLQRRLQYLGSILPMRLRDTFKFSTFQRLESMAFCHTRRDLKLFPDFAKDRLDFWFEQEDIDCDLATLSADSNPEHTSSIEIRNNELLAEIAARKAKKAALLEQVVVQEHWGHQQQENCQIPVRAKVKTRKLNIENVDTELPFKISENSDPIVRPPLEVPTTKVSVSKNSYAIFQTMFPTRNFEERTKTVPWDSLVNGMAEAGFIERHDVGGSAVQFEPDTSSPWVGQDKIVFHKPHSERVVDAIMLGAMGKRMEKWFGWSDETFEVGKKQ
ncbi:hypothetical protein BHYA_0123g00190 [Botrytis hyacinthi]|uniref:Clr5 domain-containing protein n=1 Tax=Botrytis hyacinthi TaxID=278943 RepID=A0A4Z1GPJ9_9HELO|nr:hypothetical protein BHYA_0123g00190 [Botrytis hyacinthi]